MNTLKLSERDLEILKSKALKVFPIEACALLFGEKDLSKYIVKWVLPTENKLNSPVRFEVDAQEFYKAIKKAEEKGLEFLGFFHSHQSDPTPSSIDLKFMELWENTIWLIFSTTTKSLGAYIMINGETEKLKIKIV